MRLPISRAVSRYSPVSSVKAFSPLPFTRTDASFTGEALWLVTLPLIVVGGSFTSVQAQAIRPSTSRETGRFFTSAVPYRLPASGSDAVTA